MVLTAGTRGVTSYSISYVDCSSPTILRTYDAGSVCRAQLTKEEAKPTYTILQKTSTSEIHGWKCSVKATRFFAKCGAWSHIKLSAAPVIDSREEVSVGMCNAMAITSKFRPTAATESYTVKAGRENIISFAEVGSLLEENDSVSCVGETTHINNKIHTNVVRLVTYKIIIMPVTYLVNDQKMEVVSEHIGLPCSYSEQGCVTGLGTFTWRLTKPDCPLENIRSFQPVKVLDTYLYDHDNKLLVNTTGRTKIPGCSDIELITTSYPDVFLAQQSHTAGLPALRPADLDIAVDYSMRDDYLMYEMELMVGKTTNHLEREVCRRETLKNRGEPFRLGDDYAMIKGELLYQFKCAQKEAKIKEDQVCYKDVPLEVQPPSFVDPLTKLLKQHSVVIPCSKRFPLTVRTTTGWVTIRPHVSSTTPPAEGKPEMPTTIKHEDLHNGGLYTQSEKKAWEMLISFPHYHEALLKSISWGSCVQTGLCHQEQMETIGVTNYDINRLIPSLEPLNPFEAIRKWVRTNGDYLALICIAGFLLKLLVDIVILMVTLYNEGPAAVTAMLVLMLCSTRNNYRKIRRRNRRQQEGPPAEEEEQIPLRATSPTRSISSTTSTELHTPIRGTTVLALR